MNNNFTNTETVVENENTSKSKSKLFFEILGTRIWELFALNLLFMIFSIPLITIGPATCGIVRVTRNYATDKPTSLLTDFWKGFKENFGKSLLISIPTTIILLGCYAGFNLYFALAVTYSKAWYVLLGITVIIGIVVITMNFYAYLMLLFTELKILNIYKNALIFTITQLKTNFLILILCGGLIVGIGLLWFYVKYMTLLFLFVPFAFNWFVISYNCYPIIDKYIIKPYYNS
ncbi:hypothetical protein FACS1894132_07770 [Clostridia bacterium]|nr:hypothetical protein FACS1894132_07770 [Clostridia bacterium]